MISQNLVDMLAVLLIGLRLTDKLDWQWWLVLSPIWLPILLKIF